MRDARLVLIPTWHLSLAFPFAGSLPARASYFLFLLALPCLAAGFAIDDNRVGKNQVLDVLDVQNDVHATACYDLTTL